MVKVYLPVGMGLSSSCVTSTDAVIDFLFPHDMVPVYWLVTEVDRPADWSHPQAT